MAIKAVDALNASDGRFKTLVKNLETRIDLNIRAHFDGRAVCVDLLTDRNSPPEPVLKELKRRYEAAGWAVEIKSGDDQRDGAWCYFTLTPTISPRAGYEDPVNYHSGTRPDDGSWAGR